MNNSKTGRPAKHCAWHGSTGEAVKQGEKDAIPVAMLFKNVDGARGEKLASWIAALDNGDVGTILRGLY